MDPHDEPGQPPEHRGTMFELNPSDWTTADEIRRRAFRTADHGYDVQEVRDFLGKLADWFADLNVQLSRLRKAQQAYLPETEASIVVTPVREGPAGAAVPEVGGLAARMADVLREAEEHASRVRADAELRAEQLLAQSSREAERLLEESSGLVARARAEADERSRRAAEARDALVAEIRSLRERLDEMTRRLDAVPSAEEASDDGQAPARSRTGHPAGRAARAPVVLPDAALDPVIEAVVALDAVDDGAVPMRPNGASPAVSGPGYDPRAESQEPVPAPRGAVPTVPSQDAAPPPPAGHREAPATNVRPFPGRDIRADDPPARA